MLLQLVTEKLFGYENNMLCVCWSSYYIS